ncbi:MAG: deoxyhypusine synthase family protein [Acidobacteriota bacterium]|jgi:deoxyhypusine synthase
MNISEFIRHHYRHFNAAVLFGAAEAYKAHLNAGGKMMVALGGAMSTAELGLSLAEMIRQDQVHAISCTGANLEEDVLNLLAHNEYARISNWRELSRSEEQALYDRRMNRVMDTCIPEEAMRRLEDAVLEECIAADRAGERFFPHELFYRILLSGTLQRHYQIDPKDSWVMAAAQRRLPLVIPGWEDSTVGNCYAARSIQGHLNNVHTLRTGIEYMIELADWYSKNAKTIHISSPPGDRSGEPVGVGSVGFLQVGGGIAGDFPICVVPMLRQSIGRTNLPLWGYFCQVSDAPTSYGGYSGAVPNEKITWGKLGIETPSFMIESDATIVVPLLFAYVLGW